MVCRGQNLTLRQSGTQDHIVHITHTCKDILCIPLWTVGGVCVHSPATLGSARGRSLVRPYLDGCSWYPSTTSSSFSAVQFSRERGASVSSSGGLQHGERVNYRGVVLSCVPRAVSGDREREESLVSASLPTPQAFYKVHLRRFPYTLRIYRKCYEAPPTISSRCLATVPRNNRCLPPQ